MYTHPNFTKEEMHVVSKHIKCSNSLVPKVKQIKMRFDFCPLDYYSINSPRAHKTPKKQTN